MKKTLIIILLFVISYNSFSTAFVVSSTADTDNLLTYTNPSSATNTLRKCMRLALADVSGSHTITFDPVTFNGVGGATITLGLTALPVLNLTAASAQSITIDGEAGLSGYICDTKKVTILAGNINSPVFDILNTTVAKNVTLRGLIIGRSVAQAAPLIRIRDASYNKVYGCFIGVSGTGANISMTSSPNLQIDNLTAGGSTTNNTIGGETCRNVISGSSGPGITINQSTGTVGTNFIYGNYIGLANDGITAVLNNGGGILISNGSDGNIVGGTLANQRNVISGNNTFGLQVRATSDNTVINSNYIGLNASGTAAVPNTTIGVQIDNFTGSGAGSSNQVINNVISGNTTHGVQIGLSGGTLATAPVIKGNYIGTNAAGTAVIANGNSGVRVVGANFLQIGGSGLNEGNVISGNVQHGIEFNTLTSTNVTMEKNYIGVLANGTTAAGNGSGATGGNGIHTNGTTFSNWSIKDNIISFNGIAGLAGYGINLVHATNGVNISTTITGNTINDNFRSGILLVGVGGVTIGGTTASLRNIITNNNQRSLTPAAGVIHQRSGIGISGRITALTGSIDILGNYIGLNAAGTDTIANNPPGGNPLNGQSGIGIDGITAASDGTINIGNGTVAGRNIISGNWFTGLHTNLTNFAGILNVKGNFIGLTADGLTGFGNGFASLTYSGTIMGNGAYFNNGAAATTINFGGTTAAEGNVVSDNIYFAGLMVQSYLGTLNVLNNYFGTRGDGTGSIPNRQHNVQIQSNTSSNINIGAAGSSNYFGANGSGGAGQQASLLLWDADNVKIYNNTITNGEAAGIHIFSSSNVQIGSAAAGTGNTITNNLYGILFTDQCCHWGSYPADGLLTGNGNNNHTFNNFVFNNTISSNQRNGIAFFKSPGGTSTPGLHTGNWFQSNILVCNNDGSGNTYGPPPTYDLAYFLGDNGVENDRSTAWTANTGNNSKRAPTFTYTGANTIAITPEVVGDIVQIYKTSGCGCDGQTLLGTITASASPTNFTNAAIVDADVNSIAENTSVVAYQGDVAAPTNKNTSEFSCTQIVLPIQLLNFEGKRIDENSVKLFWQTASEENNDYFNIWRSVDGINFEIIGKINGSGNSSQIVSYSFIDQNCPSQILYYKLQQVDFDGKSEYSPIAVVNGDISLTINVYPNPVETTFVINYYAETVSEFKIEILNNLGQSVYSESTQTNEGSNEKIIDLSAFSSGVYLLKMVYIC